MFVASPSEHKQQDLLSLPSPPLPGPGLRSLGLSSYPTPSNLIFGPDDQLDYDQLDHDQLD